MQIFKYEPAHVRVNDSYGRDRELYSRLFENHAAWLAHNDIQYEVVAFRWPELLSMSMSRNIMIEFELSIEDDTHAMMFRLFSGMTNDT